MEDKKLYEMTDTVCFNRAVVPQEGSAIFSLYERKPPCLLVDGHEKSGEIEMLTKNDLLLGMMRLLVLHSLNH